eukprot:NODE_28489_length_475_cov_57.054598.p2 GENE.NODE_28489_length_475_cov_57.054598~~NODE_28489_length_475_cov_57.054598.p2  ORF type:complete len:102 (-),score=5.35 NODE_28489_length_475_cov_57.054598:108-413(-)
MPSLRGSAAAASEGRSTADLPERPTCVLVHTHTLWRNIRRGWLCELASSPMPSLRGSAAAASEGRNTARPDHVRSDEEDSRAGISEPEEMELRGKASSLCG